MLEREILPCQVGSGRNEQKSRPVQPPAERIVIHADGGNADIVANMVLTSMRHLPDSEKRALVAKAARIKADRVASRPGYSDRYVKAHAKRARALERSRKEGGSLKKQLKAMYPYARVED